MDFQANTKKTTFIKTKLKKFDDKTNIDKYRVQLQILQNIILCKNKSSIN